MNATMRAKMQVSEVTTPCEGCEQVSFFPVCGSAAFGPNGESEDNTFARYTPGGSLSLQITNPDLLGKFTAGQKFYLDFTEAAD